MSGLSLQKNLKIHLRRKEVQVPTIVVAYSLHINCVDRFEKIRAAKPAKRREK